MIRRAIPFLWAVITATAPVWADVAAYQTVRDARPDGRTLDVAEMVLQRDVFSFKLGPGTFHFLAPADGKTFGAVYLGKGSFELRPATEGERRYLAARKGQDALTTLAGTFDSAVFLFADGTWSELQGKGEVKTGTPDPKADSAYGNYLANQRKVLRKNVHLQLLRYMTGSTGVAGGPFYAWVDADAMPPALIVVDPSGVMGAEESALLAIHPQQGGVWYSSHLQSEIVSGQATECRTKAVADAAHYEIDSRVLRNADLEGTTTLRFRSLVDGLQVLPLELDGSLRIRSASRVVKDGETTRELPLGVIQEIADEDSAAALFFTDPLKGGEEAVVRIQYAGDKILEDDGDGNFRVGARTSWYPNLNPSLDDDLATFDLTFRVPAKRQVVSVGTLVSSRDAGAENVSVWKADRPIRVAGFNYGTFKLNEKKEPNTGVTLRVYTNPGTPDVINEINEALRSSNTMTVQEQVDLAAEGGGYRGGLPTSPTGVGLSTDALAESAMADAVNSIQVYTKLYGALPEARVAITQQSQWTFGQAWPGLIFLPFLAALDGTTRQTLGLTGTGEFVDQVGIHEMAHQWWGQRVGWAGYRDLWIPEGFSEFSAALVLQLTRGNAAYDRFWEARRRQILEKPRGAAIRNAAAGPLTLGVRLDTDRSPTAYEALVYGKGAYILQMLRFMMRKDGPDPDSRFFETLRDFLTTYDGKSPSTADFQTLIEKRHMIPELNATRDGKLDWFFNQWVHGTEIPKYTAKFEIEKAEAGKYRIHGTVAQEGVSEGFLALVPLYLDLGKGQLVAFARAPFKGVTTKTIDTTLALPDKPKRVLANARHEVLAMD